MSPQLGKLLIGVGIVLVAVGIVMLFADRIPFLGRLPGDFTWRNGKFSVYFPFATMIIISIILTIILNLFNRPR